MTKIIPPILVALMAVGSVNAAPNIPMEQAEKLGIRKCMSSVQTLSEFLIKDTKHGSDVVRTKDDTDNHLVSYFVSHPLATKVDSQIVMTFAPSPTGCDAIYTQSLVYEKTCQQVAAEFKTWNVRGRLNKTTALQDGSTDLYLTPAGSRQQLCLVTKRETLY